MDFEIPESLQLMQDSIRRFVDEQLESIYRKVEEEDEIPEEVVQQMRDLGLFGLDSRARSDTNAAKAGPRRVFPVLRRGL